MTTASVLIIGDEILSGKFRDENGPFLIERLRALGVRLNRLMVLPDDLEVLADEVARESKRSDVVFTTGGVGPTHDDMTFEGVARAFGVHAEVHPELKGLIERYGLPVNEITLRMASPPAGSELHWFGGKSFPVIQKQNVWILPGVPSLMKKGFAHLEEQLRTTGWSTIKIYANNYEHEIAEALASLAEQYPQVSIGSYPRYGAADHRLIITIDGRDLKVLEEVKTALQGSLEWVRVDEGKRA